MKTDNKNNKPTATNKETAQNCYTIKDGCLMFILALFLPYIIFFLFVIIVNIFFNGTAFANEVLNGVVSNYISSFICQASLILGALYITKKQKASFLKSNNISFKLDYVKILIVIAIGLVALFGFNWLSDMMSYVLSLIGYRISTTSMASFGVTNFGILLVCILFMAVFPAICEEISMRGVILNGFSRKSKNFAIFISALMFMIIHLSLEQSIYQFVLGVALAIIVYYSGNILYSIILHFVNNALVLILNYVSSASLTPQKFSTFIDFFLPILTAIISGIIIYFLIKLFKLRCKKTHCISLEEKYSKFIEQEDFINTEETSSQKTETSESNLKSSNSTQNIPLRDLPKQKFEYFDSKTCLILSISIGIATWIITIVSRFI